MADISGYTAFVAGTEEDHSQEILAELMEAISRSFGGKLTVDQVEETLSAAQPTAPT